MDPHGEVIDDDLTISPIDAPRRPISRRAALRRMTLIAGAAAAVVAAETCACVTLGLYPRPINAFGELVRVGNRADFPATRPLDCRLSQAGVFYQREARAFVVHLSPDTTFLLGGAALADALATEDVLRDTDGSYWLALFQVCVHDTTTVRFFPCADFRCPSCGASYSVDGEYLDGPAPRSLDRFPLRFDGDALIVDTGRINRSVPRPEPSTRLLPRPDVTRCFPFE